jgi:hypothetical protein
MAGHVVSAAAFLTLLEFGRQVLPGLRLPQRQKAIIWLAAALGIVFLFVDFWPLRSLAGEKSIEVAACFVIAVAFIFIAGYARYLGLHWSPLLGGVAFTLGGLYFIDGTAKAIIGHYPPARVFPVRQFREIRSETASSLLPDFHLFHFGHSKVSSSVPFQFLMKVHALCGINVIARHPCRKCVVSQSCKV